MIDDKELWEEMVVMEDAAIADVFKELDNVFVEPIQEGEVTVDILMERYQRGRQSVSSTMAGLVKQGLYTTRKAWNPAKNREVRVWKKVNKKDKK